MVDSRQKGARAETLIKNELVKLTGHAFQRVPGSGALDPVHGLKGDLYIPNEKNLYAIEVKHYAEDHLTSKLLTSTNPQLQQFWEQTLREAKQTNKKPLLIFKFDRSKIFVAFADLPTVEYNTVYVLINGHEFYIAILEDWIKHEKPKFTG